MRSPQLHDPQLAVQEVSRRIEQFTSKEFMYRGDPEAKGINNLLFDILKTCLQAKTATEQVGR